MKYHVGKGGTQFLLPFPTFHLWGTSFGMVGLWLKVSKFRSVEVYRGEQILQVSTVHPNHFSLLTLITLVWLDFVPTMYK